MVKLEDDTIKKYLSLQKMKKVFTYSFIVLLAALVFYGGAGVNVISFCCDDCQAVGTEVLKEDMCCEIHGHTHEHDTMVEAADGSHLNHEKEMCCDLERIAFDWDSQYVFSIELQPVTIDLLFAGLSDISIIPLPHYKELIPIMSNGPPERAPRAYLSLLTTLLI